MRSFDVGSTSPNPDKYIKRHSPKATIGNNPRFKQTYKIYKALKRIPHSYLSNLKQVLGSNSSLSKQQKQQTISNPRHTAGIATTIPKSGRFNEWDMSGPGPGDYNISSSKSYSKLRSHTARVKSAHPSRRLKAKDSLRSMNNTSTFGHGYKYSKKRYFEEYDKAFLNREGPGPAQYTPGLTSQSIHGNAPKFTFSTATRWNQNYGMFLYLIFILYLKYWCFLLIII